MLNLKTIAAAALAAAFAGSPVVACDFNMQKNAEAEQTPVASVQSTPAEAVTATTVVAVPPVTEPTASGPTQTAETAIDTPAAPRTN